MISAIILAAGQAKRMGLPSGKQLLPLGKSTILETTIDYIIASEVDETLVVLGYQSEEISRRIAARPVKTVVNPDYLKGMSTSIAAGIAASDTRTQAYLFALGDQPFISTQVINLLLRAFEHDRSKIVVPIFDGKRGHPAIFPASYKQELLGLKGDVGARQVIARHEQVVAEVQVDSEGILLDIDTQEEYSAFSQPDL
jgi:molybdenum cofactor cytidylyltransferase